MSGGAHFIHFVLTLLTGLVWLPVWIICALCCSSGQKKRDRQLQERQLAALEEMARIHQWKGWNDK